MSRTSVKQLPTAKRDPQKVKILNTRAFRGFKPNFIPAFICLAMLVTISARSFGDLLARIYVTRSSLLYKKISENVKDLNSGSMSFFTEIFPVDGSSSYCNPTAS